MVREFWKAARDPILMQSRRSLLFGLGQLALISFANSFLTSLQEGTRTKIERPQHGLGCGFCARGYV